MKNATLFLLPEVVHKDIRQHLRARNFRQFKAHVKRHIPNRRETSDL